MEAKEVKKNRKNQNRGFTLIELLAVIIILGILMATAIPSMTKYIENSKKDAFWQTAKTYVNAARYGLLNDEFGNTAGSICSLPPTGQATVVPTSIITLEKGSKKSAWNKDLAVSYVVCVDEGTADKPKYVYYYSGKDTDNNGIPTATKEDALSRGVVKRGGASAASQPALNANVSVGGQSRKVSQICS